ncbi:MAG: DNA translocase FtsK 4TM domain-containing protein, partial [Henriciella sp.]|uniref:DNA translocase FtsK n=1 Tax=Henriciella sp. TaxID=1968823 RepID=UPI003C75AB26
MANSVAQTQNVRESSDPVWRILTGTAAFAIGVFLCGSVGSYQSTDPSLNAATAMDVQNLFGGTGAIVADLALQTFGFASWMAGLSLMVGGAMRAVLIGAPKMRRWAYGAGFVVILSGALASFPVPASWPLWSGLGGMFGDFLYDLAIVPFKALLMPAPNVLAGLFLGAVALVLAFSALGFRRGDARLLQTAAASSGRRAAAGAGSVGARLFGGLGGLFDKKTHASDDEFDGPAVSRRAPVQEDEPEEAGADYEDTEADDDLPIAATRPKLTPAKPREAERPRPTVRKRARRGAKILPSIDLLQDPPSRRGAVDEDGLLAQANRLSEVLREFGVRGRIKEVRPGPVVTLFELEPAAGVKSARVISLADDIARSMSAVSARVAVIPGKNAIGIELPNEERETVYFRSLLSSTAYTNAKAPLPMALGEDIGGTPTVVDLSKMPHLLIAGTTGSGKSVGVNAMILSLIYRLSPEQCRFIMIDPKMLELSIYEGIPHLLAPVVTDPKKAVNALQWAVREMESRYELMSKAGVRNLAGFNEKAAKYRERGDQMTRKVQTGYDDRGKPVHETEILPLDHIPNIVVVIDEMADLMMV